MNTFSVHSTKVLNLIREAMIVPAGDMRNEKVHKLFQYCVVNKDVLLANKKLTNILQEKLTSLYHIENWEPAKMYYFQLFGVNWTIVNVCE